jgi:hypothetical protein
MGRTEVNDYKNDIRLQAVLINMTQDDTLCFHCIQTHIGSDELQAFIQNKHIHTEMQENLKSFRTVFNILLITTSFITFIVFGGANLIFIISLCSSLFIFFSIYLNNISHIVIFEASVGLFSLIIFLKLSYAIVYAIILDQKKKSG